MGRVSKDTGEFIAKIYSDLGKAVLTVGFASYFFEKLPLLLRVGFIVFGIFLLILSVFIFDKANRGE